MEERLTAEQKNQTISKSGRRENDLGL